MFDRIINHLKLTFFATMPSPLQIGYREILTAAEAEREYFYDLSSMGWNEIKLVHDRPFSQLSRKESSSFLLVAIDNMLFVVAHDGSLLCPKIMVLNIQGSLSSDENGRQ